MARLILSNGEEREINPSADKFSLEELQKIVGGYIEIIRIDSERDMVINEEGKIDKLPYNAKATEIYQEVYNTIDFIVGDVLICNVSQIM